MMFKTVVLLSLLHFTAGSQIYELKCWTQKRQQKPQSVVRGENIMDVVDCVKKCREKEFCHIVAMVYNRSRPWCWMQSENTIVPNVDSLIYSNYVTNYLLYDPTCGEITAGVDLSCWTVTPGYRIMGKIKKNLNSLADCFEECIKINECWSVDWDVSTSPMCWVQSQPLDVSSPKIKSPSVTNFVLNRNCLELIAGLDVKFWIISDGMEYPSLSPVDKWDIRSCMEYCKFHNLCNMFDYIPSAEPPCWAKTESFDVQRWRMFENEDGLNFFFNREEYEASLKIAASFAEMSPCWFFQNDTSYSGAGITAVPSVKTLKKCLGKCFLNYSCGAAVFTPLPMIDRPCLHVLEHINMLDFTEMRRVYSYIPRRQCSP